MRTVYALLAVLALGSALAADPLQPASAPSTAPLAAAENLHPIDPSAAVPQAPPTTGTVVRVPSNPEQTPQISAVVTSTDQFSKRDASCAASPITKCCSRKVKVCCHTSCFGDVSPWVDLAPLEAGPWQNTRLPTDILPSAYDISIQTDVASSNVIGSVAIDATIVKATRYVIVHSWRQNLTNISITTGTASAPRAVAVKDAFFFPNLDYFIVLTENELPPGPCRINIGFSNKLAKIAIGFFKTQYRKPGGATSVMASTHFEALYARRAFPCFDEPAMKAVFSVSLTVPTEMVALSNMPMVKEQPATPAYSTTKAPVTWKRVQFAPSVKMSSYLVAFSICDFAFAEVIYTRPNSTSSVPIRVYAPPHLIEHTQYALKSAVAALTYYEDKFRIPYALPKLDMIALPDFKTGSSAMENWGLVTFTQHRLIYNMNRPSSSRKHALTSTLTHEIAHQWFGNLVTMKWWNDLWLNEGFATFADFTALNVLKPKWKRFEALLLRTRKAFLFDSLDAARPLHAAVGGRLHEVNVLFDGISYAKGCAIVRMVQDFLTVNGDMEPFFAGLRRYLNNFKFNNAEDTDLWSSLRDSLKERDIALDVPEIMATWTRQAGYPYITVSNGQKGEVQVSQARFRLAPEDPTVSNHSDRWNVPITYVTRKFPKWRRLHWLPATEGSSSISLVVPPNAPNAATADDDTILLANPGQKGFYRVNYAPSHWDYLANLLQKRPTVFEPIDRAGLLDDAFEFGRAGTLDYGTILDLTEFLHHEKSYVPWVVAFEGFFFVRTRLLNSQVSKPLKKYVLSKIQPLLRRLGANTKRAFKRNGPRTRFLRSLAFTAALVYGDKRVRAEAKRYWDIFQKNPRKALRKIPGPISVAVLRSGIENGGRKEFNFLWKLLKKPRKYRIRKTALLIALAHSRSPKLLSKVLHATLNTKKFRGRDRLTTMLAVSRTPRGAGAVLDFLTKHYNSTAIQDLPLAAVLKKALSNLDTKERLDQFSDFFSKQPRTAGTRTFCQVKELIRANQRWVPQNEEKVCLWLKAKGFYPNGTCN